MNDYKTGCLICGKELVYLDQPEAGRCIFCNREYEITVKCADGHFVCDSCHSKGAIDLIAEFCVRTDLANPVEMANILMNHPSIKMHGPEHHFLVPAVLLSAYYNVKGEKEIKAEKIGKAKSRAEKVPGGFCGSHGNCGAAVGTGIFISIVTGANSLSGKSWQLSNMITAKSLLRIAEKGGPRCCKRDTYLALTEAAAFSEEHLNIRIPVPDRIVCSFSLLNKECLKQDCMYYEDSNKGFSVSDEDLKRMVREKYGEIAGTIDKGSVSCCGETSCCSGTDYSVFSEDYRNMKGYNPDADLSLGCGIPTEFAGIRAGDTVLDLGSGAGNDCFVARAITGESSRIIGLDMTENMVIKARQNVKKLGYKNVEFILGEIEQIPLDSETADVVISNCVLNLVPDKEQAFSEIYRVLKKGGHFCISDVVLSGKLPDELKSAAEMYAGCVSGAIEKEEYLNIISKTGFNRIEIKREKKVEMPDHVLVNYLSLEQLKNFHESQTGIFSVTVYAEKL